MGRFEPIREHKQLQGKHKGDAEAEAEAKEDGKLTDLDGQHKGGSVKDIKVYSEGVLDAEEEEEDEDEDDESEDGSNPITLIKQHSIHENDKIVGFDAR